MPNVPRAESPTANRGSDEKGNRPNADLSRTLIREQLSSSRNEFVAAGYELIATSFATVFMFRAVPRAAAGMTSFDWPMPCG